MNFIYAGLTIFALIGPTLSAAQSVDGWNLSEKNGRRSAEVKGYFMGGPGLRDRFDAVLNLSCKGDSCAVLVGLEAVECEKGGHKLLEIAYYTSGWSEKEAEYGDFICASSQPNIGLWRIGRPESVIGLLGTRNPSQLKVVLGAMTGNGIQTYFNTAGARRAISYIQGQ